MKKCSYCAEEIQDEAIKCRHCGEMLGAMTAAAGSPAPETALPEPAGSQVTEARPLTRLSFQNPAGSSA